MHFSIPDTFSFVNENNTYTGFNIHINGSFHCCLRFKQLHSLHEQLKRSLSTLVLPSFPPKQLLPLTPSQLEQRRIKLERYIQLIGQDPVFSKSDLLRTFLLNAQQESSYTENREITLDIYLMNGFRIPTTIYTIECSSKVLEKACQCIDLTTDYTYYFSLYLMRKENDGGITLIRKLSDFESPYISQRLSDDCKIVIRKSYWDQSYDLELMRDRIAQNLLYIQTVSDVERGWIITTKDDREQLSNLQARGNKKEYLEIVSKLPSYGCIQFPNAIVDYPEPNTVAVVTIGNRELSIRTNLGKKIQETKFKVTRMRCWRVSTIHNNEEISSNSSTESQLNNHELSFEYLMSKNLLKWITISSEQSMLMSVCLQNIVDELLNQKSGNDMNNMVIQHNTQLTQLSYIRRDGTNNNNNNNNINHNINNNYNRLHESNSQEQITSTSNINEMDMPICQTSNGVRNAITLKQRIKEKFTTSVFFRVGKDSVHNDAFEVIGDDDL